MCKKLIYLISFVLVLGLVGTSTAESDDPNLVGWWTFDESPGPVTKDFSGKSVEGTLFGEPTRGQEGRHRGILLFDGVDDYVFIDGLFALPVYTIALWFRVDDGTGQRDIFSAYALTVQHGILLELQTDGTLRYLHRYPLGLDPTTGTNIYTTTTYDDGAWYHAAMVKSVDTITLYINSEQVGSAADSSKFDPGDAFGVALGILDNERGLDRMFPGAMDDIRIYNRVLSQDEIQTAMKGEVWPYAWGPEPADGAMDTDTRVNIIWSPGDFAVLHDVYLGTDVNDVNEATRDNPLDVLVSQNQDDLSYDPPVDLEFNQTYYWRIDEVNDAEPNSPWKGEVWSFTVANFTVVDDFEGYDDVNNVIYDVWTDYFVNNTGMTVGHLDPPFVEKDIVHSGKQSIYMRYDNDGTVNEGTSLEQTGTLFYSEAQREWVDPQDWTKDGAESLTTWFRGLPPIYGSFTAEPPTYTMTARGVDIWETSDEFHYAYKQLSGNGSITARVVSLTDTHQYAKAGVMIRESLTANSKHALVVVQPVPKVAFQRRINTGGTTAELAGRDDITAPHWVKLTRSGNRFIAEHSVDGTAWTDLSSVYMPMLVDAYIGLCLTSHNVNETCTAEFSDVTIDGTVTGDWQSQDIGIQSNIPEPMYIVLEDEAANSAVVKNPDAGATATANWTEWNIPFTDFTGVNMQTIKKMFIGVGDRANTDPGSAGDLYIDDIRLHLPSPAE